MSNREISSLFAVFAELLLLHKKNERLSSLLSGASYRIRKMADEIESLNKDQLSKLFNPEIVSQLDELKREGTIMAVDELIQLTPAGLFEMMRIKGLGGKRLSVLWKTAGIDSLENLLQACKEGEVSEIPGFGTKTEQNIIESIESYFSSRDRFHYATVADSAGALVHSLQRFFKTKFISLCGEIRRQTTTVESIELIAAGVLKKLKDPRLRKLLIVQASDKRCTKAHTLDEIPVVIYHTTPTRFHYDLFIRTGNDKHTRKILSKIKTNKSYSSEEMIYKDAGLPYIVPEMREDVAEWYQPKQHGELITLQDIKGVVHNHTTWSDGVNRLSEFVMACKKLNYEYVVISDHSKNAHYAGGLKEEKVLKQMDEIDKLNEKLAPFRIFKSIECDILISGELDYNDELLKKFDLVIVSIHQLLRMDEKKATLRLTKAIENPHTTILGHMTGRQLLIRPGYPVSFKKIIDACAANEVVIEINANPYRLDMDWSHIPYAVKKGVMISINPDAHSIGEINNIRWGISAARKGGLTREMTWNAMSLPKIKKWLDAKKNKLNSLSRSRER